MPVIRDREKVFATKVFKPAGEAFKVAYEDAKTQGLSEEDAQEIGHQAKHAAANEAIDNLKLSRPSRPSEP